MPGGVEMNRMRFRSSLVTFNHATLNRVTIGLLSLQISGACLLFM